MKRVGIAISFLLLLASCSIHGNFEGLYSYYGKTREKIPTILVEPNDTIQLCDLVNIGTPEIYIANATTIKKCIGSGDAVVYIWKPRCAAKFCYALNIQQEKCDKINKQLIIVAQEYDAELMQLSYKTKRPIFAIDTRYYKSDLTSRYLSAFLTDLKGDGHMTGRVLYFKNGVFAQAADTIDSLRL